MEGPGSGTVGGNDGGTRVWNSGRGGGWEVSKYRGYFLFRTIRVEFFFVTSLMMLRKEETVGTYATDGIAASLRSRNSIRKENALKNKNNLFKTKKRRCAHCPPLEKTRRNEKGRGKRTNERLLKRVMEREWIRQDEYEY